MSKKLPSEQSCLVKNKKSFKGETIILAFSGGLDTSFCVPYLIEQGFQVVTAFIDSGGVSNAEKEAIKRRALALGAFCHEEVSITEQLWEEVITPLVYADHWYQNQYPLLCSDRYLIVSACLSICDKYQTQYFAHGCTGMGNDQVRFDMSVACLGDYKIIAPIREIQRKTRQVREYEQAYLAARGFSVSLENKSYSVNQNLLGITVSGAEIDQFKAPLCRHKAHYSFDDKKPTLTSKKQLIKLGFDKGNIVKFNQHTIGETISRQDFLTQLNQLADAYHVGEGIYCGDTTIGIKGRILFKAPALEVLMVAHRALEECVNSKSQNRFKASIAQKWCELVYEGLFFDPLKADLQAYLVSSQQKVTGQVTIELTKNNAIAIAVDSPNLLIESNATYAQSCDWSIEQAEGFIKLFGQSTRLACKIKNSNSALANIAESAGSHFNEGV